MVYLSHSFDLAVNGYKDLMHGKRIIGIWRTIWNLLSCIDLCHSVIKVLKAEENKVALMYSMSFTMKITQTNDSKRNH